MLLKTRVCWWPRGILESHRHHIQELLLSGVLAAARGGGINLGFRKVVRKKFPLVGTFSSKNAKFGAKTPIFGTFRSKTKILSTHNFLHRKFAADCRKIVTSCPLLP